MVVATIESLIGSSLWGVPPLEIAKRLSIPDKTFYRHLKHETVKPTWDDYQRKSLGKTPADLKSLDFDDARGFSTLS